MVNLKSISRTQLVIGSVILYFTLGPIITYMLYYTLILDNGGSKNFVSPDFVQRVGLQRIFNCKPHSFSWLHQGNKLGVRIQDVKFVKSFSTGDLSGNEVLCEVVPRSTSQILLG